MYSPTRKTTLITMLILAAASGPLAAQTASAPTDPLEAIVQLLNKPDGKEAGAVLAALRATDDKDLGVFYAALAKSGNKDWRVASIGALADLSGKDAAAVFSDRLKNDPSMVVRTESLLALIALKVITADELAVALEAPDENIQCIAARTLVLQGQKKDLASAALKKLVSSKDVATAAMSRMALLGLGEKEYFEPLQVMLKDPATSGDVLAILLEQVSEEKITAARDLLGAVLKSDQPWQIKLRAFRAESALSDAVPASLTQALAADGQTVFRVHLMRILAWRTDSAAALADLAKGEGTIATLARFEQARVKGGDEAGTAAVEVVKLAHPVVIDYILDRARLDVKDKPGGAEFYIPALVQAIESVHGDPQQVRQEHFRAAKAATILADMAAPKADAELKRLLGGKYTAITRVVATGLLRSKNAASCDLMRPLLKSPYDELSTDAALLLGRFGDKDALPLLTALASKGEKHSSLLQTMAGWYILKITGRSKAAAEELAKTVSK